MKKTYLDIFAKISSHDFVYLFSDPPYLFFALSVVFSQIAFNMLSVVLIFLVFHLTNSNFSVSILLLTILLPQILLSFMGGVVADVSNKRTILIYGNILRAAALAVLFFNSTSVALVYLVSIIVSSITQFYVPAETPLIPLLAKKNRLIAANSIFGIGLFSSILVGYVLAGPVVQSLGRSSAFLFLIIFFLVAAVFAFLIPKKIEHNKLIPDRLDIHVRKSIRHEFKESISMIRNTTHLIGAFSLLAFSQVIILILSTLIPGYAKTLLQVPAEDLSLILFAPAAIGMIVAAFILSTIFKKANKTKLMNTGVLMSGLVLVLLPFASRTVAQDFLASMNRGMPAYLQVDLFLVVLFLAFLAGFGNAFIFVPSQAIIQEVIPESFRSKIYGLLFAFIGVFSLLPIIVSGTIADIFGVGSVLTTIGILVLFMALIRFKQMRKK